MSKVLLTGGCSFSQATKCRPLHLHQGGDKFVTINNLPQGELYDGSGTWPDHLLGYTQNYPWHTGIGASGNKLIFRRVYNSLKYLLHTYEPKDIEVFVMWTQPERCDVYLSKGESILYDEHNSNLENNRELLDTMTHIKNDEYSDNERPKGYIRSGGIGSGNSRMINLYYKYFYTLEEHLINTYEYIINLQNILNNLNIKYYFMTYQNIFTTYEWQDGEYGTPINCDWNSKFDLLWGDFFQNDNLKYLVDDINFDKFIFHNNDKHQFGGLGEYCVDNNLPLDQGHPTSESHESFTKEVILPCLS